ncbi:MAG: response regulator [Anaerolineae bacterium]|nr:response regulator [Anaerolineae bacterium]
MLDAEELDEQLLDALTHLYDPDYEPPVEMYELTLCSPSVGATPVQATLIQTIQGLKPQDDLPVDAHLRRVYEVIHNRFMLKLTQEKTAELMDISVRHLNRVQRVAVHRLLQRLWENRQSSPTPSSQGAGSAQVNPGFQALDWKTQTRRELASLQASAPDAIADVSQTIAEALELQRPQLALHSIEAQIAFVQPGLIAAFHPSVLRQMLITAISRLIRFRHSEPISIFAGLENANVRITITANLISEPMPMERDLIQDILAPEGAKVEAHFEGCHLFIRFRVPSVRGKATVLVVDDNADMAHFYRRATIGTRYHIVHIETGERLLDTVDSVSPDVIILDVMLPDIDGWQLLMQLHQNQTTRPIPVIVCTVVREQELALSLGAAQYISKPVRPREFIQALDRVLSESPTIAMKAPE